MTTRTSGGAAFILTIGLLACLAGPVRAADTTARDNVATSSPTNPSGPQTAQTGQAAGNSLTESDRAARPDEAIANQAETPRVSPVVAGQNTSWEQTSLIGKIFIGFGTLLTIASAARMFMA